MSEQFSEYDLIQAISGRDSHGDGKCTIAIQPQRCNADGKVVNTVEEYVTDKPVVQMFKQTDGFILVDLIFDSINDIDLQRIYTLFQDFFASTNSASDINGDFPIIVLSVVPRVHNGEYWTLGLNPVFYSLVPNDVSGEPSIIRLLFVEQPDSDAIPNFFFMHSDLEDLEKLRDEDREEDDEYDEYDDAEDFGELH